MFKKLIIISLIIGFLFNPSFFVLAQAQENTPDIYILKEVSIATDKDIYKAGEEIKIISLVNNPFFEIKNWEAVFYFMALDESFSEVGQVKDLTVNPGQTEKIEMVLQAPFNLAAGDYKIKLEIIEQDNVIAVKNISIKLTGYKPLGATVQLCLNENCQQSSNIFKKKEKVFLSVDSKIEDLQLQGFIQFNSSDNKQEIVFKDNMAVFEPEEIGAYKVSIFISKKGYQKIFFKKDFSVIEKEPIIQSISVCKVNGKCTGEETAQNCPQDCLRLQKDGVISTKNIVLAIIGMSIVIIIIIIAYYFLVRNKEEENDIY